MSIIIDILLTAGLVLMALTLMGRSLLKSTIGLAAVSAILTMLIFRLTAPLAAVFELSICAGLITVVFISTISLAKPLTYTELKAHAKGRMARYLTLPLLLVVIGTVIFLLPIPEFPIKQPIGDVREIIWNDKELNILGQVIIMLVGVFGVVMLFKERKENDDLK